MRMKKPHPVPARTSAPHEVRLIGGLWKRSKLPVPDLPGLRPTPSRVRETLFNWLGQNLTGWRCLDAFAGSGALGFEAASRGAAEVLLIEQNPSLCHTLNQNKTRLSAHTVQVQRGDGLAALRQRAGQGWDVVFLDPPFQQGNNDELVRNALAAARDMLAPEGLIYLEAPRPWQPDELASLGLHTQRLGQAGQVAFHLLRPLPAA
ncbi:MAG: Ribosomal small subunit methyltransferase [Pseudomonadota bacterium]|jgi:16S rRNA (guanine(966)-N(2))-methyltransferase RsmD